MNPKWLEGPYTIVKKIGPVNYAVQNRAGVAKVLHHNNIKPAGYDMISRYCPVLGGNSQQHRDLRRFSESSEGIHPVVLREQVNPSREGELKDTIDKVGFSRKVFGQLGEIRTRSGRISKPVNRLNL